MVYRRSGRSMYQLYVNVMTLVGSGTWWDHGHGEIIYGPLHTPGGTSAH
jgi:hypothetical protein